jgi:predicted lipid-binding transport protein (Tim44 family)
MMVRRWLLALLPVVIMLGAGLSDARPGGGNTSSGSFRSSSSSSSGGYRSSGGYSSSGSWGTGYHSGSSGDFGAVVFVLFLIVVVVVLIAWAKQKSGPSWTNDPEYMAEPMPPPAPSRVDLDALIERDPKFSLAVFEDLAFELYAAAHRARGTAKLDALQPYLSPVVAAQLNARGASPQQVVIGTLRIARSSVLPQSEHISVLIEATHIGVGEPIFAVEHWLFSRQFGAQSKPPDRTRTWPCPNCSAPWQPSPSRNCANCGQAVEVGKFDWCVDDIDVESESRALASLTGTVPEYGNELPTMVHPDAYRLMAEISASDPEVTLDTMKPRVELIYHQLNAAWNARDLTPVRGLVTAALRSYLEYWLREYAHQGLHNTLSDAEIGQIDLAKVTRDQYFDAITVRIFASGFDYTTDAKDRVVGGSKAQRRAYTEYWTFLRASTRRGQVTATPSCPNCGAPLKISDVGDCTYCGVAVESGSFDWTLSKIEQDDNYSA